MNNCLVFGSGRCGTSALMSMLSEQPYFLGSNVLKRKRISNPLGIYECSSINSINEKIIADNTENKIYFLNKFFRNNKPTQDQRWLSQIAIDKTLETNEKVINKIKALLDVQSPICLKDPRFSFTLPIWKPHLPSDCKYIVMFRDPNNTVQSILREINERDYLRNLKMSSEECYEFWINIYSHVLKNHNNSRSPKNWLFINFDDLLFQYETKKIIEDHLNLTISNHTINFSYSRSRNNEMYNVNSQLKKQSSSIFRKLIALTSDNK